MDLSGRISRIKNGKYIYPKFTLKIGKVSKFDHQKILINKLSLWEIVSRPACEIARGFKDFRGLSRLTSIFSFKIDSASAHGTHPWKVPILCFIYLR